MIIRWGPDAPFDWIRTKSVCDVCGHRGADTQMPSWANMVTGFQPFPEFKWDDDICNLYSMTKSQDAIRKIRKALRDDTDNMPLLLAIYPDQMAPVIRHHQREIG